MPNSTLRDRIREADRAEWQKQLTPALMALQSAAHEVTNSATALKSAAQRPTPRQTVTLLATGMLLYGLISWGLSLNAVTLTSDEQRQLRLGARIEAVWPSLTPSDRARIESLLSAH